MVVVGQGYVGLPLALAIRPFVRRVYGLDSDNQVVQRLANGLSHVTGVSDREILDSLPCGYEPTTDDSVLQVADVIIICVPTPLDGEGNPNIDAIESVAKKLSKIKERTLVILESTTYPGTTEEVLLPSLLQGGRQVDKDFFLAFSPERVDPGNPHWNISNTPRLVGGISELSASEAVAFYRQFVSSVSRLSGVREAEMAKLIENSYRQVNIALVNELLQLSNAIGVDFWESLRGASTKPYGFAPFYPGPGVGGHCIPIDPKYLNFAFERALGAGSKLITTADQINSLMPSYVVAKAESILNASGIDIGTSKLLVVGVSYKANVSDTRESPAIKILEILEQRTKDVEFFDPLVPKVSLDSGKQKESIRIADGGSKTFDLVILIHKYSIPEVKELLRTSKRILDTTGTLSGKNNVSLL